MASRFLLLPALVLAATACDDDAPDDNAPIEQDHAFTDSTAASLLTCWANAIDLMLPVGVDAADQALEGCMVPDAEMTFRFPGQSPITLEGRREILGFITDRWTESNYVLTQHVASNAAATSAEGSFMAYITGIHNRADLSSDVIGADYQSEAALVDREWVLVAHDAAVTTFSFTPAPPAP